MALKINNETKVGLLGAISIALLILGYTFLRDTKIFQKNFVLNARYQNVSGLAMGNAVYLNGARVGLVRNLEIDKKSGDITVTFNVEEGMYIPIDSKAMIYDADLLGTKAVKIIKGQSPQNSQTGQFIEGGIDKSLSDQVKEELLPLKDQIQDFLGQLDRLVIWINATLDETNGNRVDKIMENFAGVSDNFLTISVKVDSLAGSASGVVIKANSILGNIKDQNESIAKIMNNVGNFSDSLVVATNDIRVLFSKASGAIGDIENLIEKVNTGDNTIGKLVNDTLLYKNVNAAVNSLDSLVKNLTDDPSIHLYHHLGTKWNTAEEKRDAKERQEKREGTQGESGKP